MFVFGGENSSWFTGEASTGARPWFEWETGVTYEQALSGSYPPLPLYEATRDALDSTVSLPAVDYTCDDADGLGAPWNPHPVKPRRRFLDFWKRSSVIPTKRGRDDEGAPAAKKFRY